MRMSSALAGAIALAAGSVALATTYGPGPGGPIPDRGTTGVGPPASVFTSTINVPDNLPILTFNNVSLNFGTGTGPTGEHTFIGDLVIRLTAPNGDDVHVISRVGATTATSFGRADDLAGGPYVFVNSGGLDIATTPAVGGNIPVGTYNRATNNPAAPPPPDPDDYNVFAGDNAGGTWTLTIEDWAGGDTGGLASWTLDMTLIPEPGSIGLLGAGALLPLLRRRRN